MKSSIKGYYGTYQDAFNAVGKRFLESRKFSIQRSNEANRHGHVWILIYYGDFV